MKDLNYWKKKLIDALKVDTTAKSLSEFLYPGIMIKSIDDYPELVKGKGYDVGTIRTWSGKEFKKLSSGKWMRTFSGTEERGERQAVHNVMNKIQSASTMEELLSVIRDNRERFVDESGSAIPVVKEFLDVARATESGKKKKEKAKDKKLQQIRDQYESGPSETGDTDDIYVGKEEITGTWKLVESSAPSASHDEKTFNKTENFPTGKDGTTINDRDYEKDKAAQLMVHSIASEFDGRAVSFDTPVIVTQDGVVVSGNNRTMSSKIAAEKGTDKKYIEALKKRSKKFGFSPEDVDKFKNPRVVFEIDNKEEYSTDQFAKFNETHQKTMSPIETAVKMSKIIHDDVVKDVSDKIQEFDTLGELYTNKKAVTDVFNALQKGGVVTEFTRPQYETEGVVSGTGKEFLETVMIGSVVNEANIRGLNREGAKSIRKKLVRAITPLVRNKGLGGYSVSDELNRAIDVSMQVKLQKDKFSSIEDFANQSSLFEAKDDVAIELAKKLDMKEKDFADFMQKMNANLEVGASGQADMFFGDVETKDQVLDRMLKKALDTLNRLQKRILIRRK